jgi:hypothetical protein
MKKKKVEINERIHSLNLLGENNLEGVQKTFQKYHLLTNGACIRMSKTKTNKNEILV